jgi:hypothetical protein
MLPEILLFQDLLPSTLPFVSFLVCSDWICGEELPSSYSTKFQSPSTRTHPAVPTSSSRGLGNWASSELSLPGRQRDPLNLPVSKCCPISTVSGKMRFYSGGHQNCTHDAVLQGVLLWYFFLSFLSYHPDSGSRKSLKKFFVNLNSGCCSNVSF